MSAWKIAYGVNTTDLEQDRIIGDKVLAAVLSKDVNKIREILVSLLPKSKQEPKPVIANKTTSEHKAIAFVHLMNKPTKAKSEITAFSHLK